MTGQEDGDPRGRKRAAPGAGRGRRADPRGAEALKEIERRLGGLLGGLSGALARLSDAIPPDDGGTSRGGGEVSPVRAEVSVRVGGLSVGASGASAASDPADDRDPARPVAPVPADRGPAASGGGRMPHLEVFETDAEWVLTAELPGVELSEVAFRIERGRLHLATTGPRAFAAETEVPAWLCADALRPGLVNGILELRACRPDAPGTAEEEPGA